MLMRENNISLWQHMPLPQFPRLSSSTRTDVCVVGAGIAGLTTAYHLAAQGYRVIVLESDAVGSGQTGRTTAHLTHAMDDRFSRLQKLHGAEALKLITESHTAAIDQIERTVCEEDIRCDFARVDGYLILGYEHDFDFLNREYTAALESGLGKVECVEQVPLLSEGRIPAIKFPGQAQFHPLKYLTGLAAAVIRKGGRIYAKTHVVNVQSQGKNGVEILTQNGYRVDASAVVIATNVPVNDRFAIHTKQYPYRSYVVGLKMLKPAAESALIWDTSDPYHYVRTYNDVLVVGGEDHKTGQTDEYFHHYGVLEDWARAHFSGLGEIKFRWSGQVIEPMDGLAYIGRNPGDENVYIATGDSGQGLTHGTIAGLLLTDLIRGKSHPWEKIYDPKRVRLRAAPTYVTENANVAAQYTDWVRGGDSEIKDLPNDSGTVIRRGLQKIAVYKDPEGQTHQVSANCPHLHGVVRWNATEKTWDCPCHGSRFDRMGGVIEGPAICNLKPVGEEEAPDVHSLPVFREEIKSGLRESG